MDIKFEELREKIELYCGLVLYQASGGNLVHYSEEHKSHLSGTVCKINEDGFLLHVTNKRMGDFGCFTSFKNVEIKFSEVEKLYREGKIVISVTERREMRSW